MLYELLYKRKELKKDSMNITFLIGNGFDRNLGLNTTYSDFTKHYKNLETNNERIKQFRKDIDDDKELWFDAEIAMGKYTEKFGEGEAAAYSECHTDFCMELAKYLKNEEKRIDFNNCTDIHTHFVMNSVNFETGKKFHQTEKEMEERKRYSNRLCREYGLSETEVKSDYKNIPKWKLELRRTALAALKWSRTKEEFIEYMENHGYKVKWEDGYKYITFTTPDGNKCRDNKLFCDQLLKINMEIYFRLGGCDSPIAEPFHEHKTYIYEGFGYTPGVRLLNLLGDLLSIAPEDSNGYTPEMLTELEKEDIEILEELLGRRVEPNAFLHYSTREEYEQSQGLSWSW